MGRVRRNGGNHAQALLKRKGKSQDEVEKLREENRRLRELVAHLSKLAVIRIAAEADSGE
jgi:hypothetical protein